MFYFAPITEPKFIQHKLKNESLITKHFINYIIEAQLAMRSNFLVAVCVKNKSEKDYILSSALNFSKSCFQKKKKYKNMQRKNSKSCINPESGEHQYSSLKM